MLGAGLAAGSPGKPKTSAGSEVGGPAPLGRGSHAAHLEAPLLGHLSDLGQHGLQPPVLLLQDPDADVVGLHLPLHVVRDVARACGEACLAPHSSRSASCA